MAKENPTAKLDEKLASLPMPTIDMTKATRKWRKKFQKLQHEGTRYERVLNNLQPDGHTVADIEAFEEMYQTYEAKMEDTGRKQAAMIAELVVDVPGDAVIDGAPDDLDWSDVESYDYMREDVFSALVVCVAFGYAEKIAAKK